MTDPTAEIREPNGRRSRATGQPRGRRWGTHEPGRNYTVFLPSYVAEEVDRRGGGRYLARLVRVGLEEDWLPDSVAPSLELLGNDPSTRRYLTKFHECANVDQVLALAEKCEPLLRQVALRLHFLIEYSGEADWRQRADLESLTGVEADSITELAIRTVLCVMKRTQAHDLPAFETKMPQHLLRELKERLTRRDVEAGPRLILTCCVQLYESTACLKMDPERSEWLAKAAHSDLERFCQDGRGGEK